MSVKLNTGRTEQNKTKRGLNFNFEKRKNVLFVLTNVSCDFLIFLTIAAGPRPQ
jgi:hypothetical protein